MPVLVNISSEVMALAVDMMVSQDTSDIKAATRTVLISISILFLSLEQAKANSKNESAVNDVYMAASEASEILLNKHCA